MARPLGSSFRLPLPFLFLFLPAVLVATLLAGAVVPSTPNNQQPSLLVLAVGDGDFESLAAQEGSSAPTRGNMDIIFVAEPSPARCDITSCKKVCSSSTTTTPTLLQSMGNSHGSVMSSPKLRYFCISTFNLPGEFLASICVEVGFLARWLRRQCSSPLQCAWVPPLLYLYKSQLGAMVASSVMDASETYVSGMHILVAVAVQIWVLKISRWRVLLRRVGALCPRSVLCLLASMEVAMLFLTFGLTSDFSRCWSSDLTKREAKPNS